ncbi:hypothetical protein GCM10011491_41820 [Brucella endophytica]|uniref:56B-like ribbon-helix-helix domain-containing protein n=1 Tax=Brucella endophytica TaxID=1963359 RepID=A0A916SPC2_9HYPH|nr:hypothetical protein [Brucella endophytica]GGB09477.1 hypothetical protein GCM10011491_41820 [Brucella endophytica]
MPVRDVNDILSELNLDEPVRSIPQPVKPSEEGPAVMKPKSERSIRKKAQALLHSDKRKEKQTSIAFTPEFHMELKLYAVRNNTTIVAVVETAVREYMAKN